MDKLKQETADRTQENIARIGELFPNVITEMKDENGKLKKGINFEILKQLLSGDVVDGEESYDFTWVGKKASIVEANTPIRKTLRPCIEESKNWETTENLYIEGDNLDVLKLLQESYLNSVKMIYIDPPYNTGNDFIYRDRFMMDKVEYEEQLGMYDEVGNRLFQYKETEGRFHSDWCSMMYSRLKLARSLLTEDGVVFISIDDNEVHNLRKICDEIFGQDNFIANFVWSAGRKNDSRFVSISHEYIYCYVKNQQYLKEQGILWRERKQGLDEIYKEYNLLRKKFGNDFISASKELKRWYKNLPDGHPAKDHSHYNRIDARGIYFPDNISWPGGGGPDYILINPETGTPAKTPSRGWVTNQETMLAWVASGLVDFGDGGVPCKKAYLEDREKSVPYSVFYKDGRAATKRLMDLFGAKVFDNPKDEEIIARLIAFTGTDNCTTLDFFSGSATTAHAVMQLNAEDGGNRKFIMVQLPEPCDEKSEAFKAGYKNICEIGKERIRRAGDKINKEIEESNRQLKLGEEPKKPVDIGFRVLKVDTTNMKDIYYAASEYTQNLLTDQISNIKEDRTDLDLLYGVLLEWGLPLSLKHEIEEIDGVKIHVVDNDSLIACFAESVSETVVREIAKRQPLRAVFRDSSFASSSDKINVEEIFKLLAPNTSVKVI